MSVAFRRESDEEHKEPRFELPIPHGQNYVTARGAALIEAMVLRLEREIEQGGAEDAIETLRRDLRYWQTRRTTMVLTSPPADGTVGFGTRVDFALNGTIRAIEIVGDDEADPAAGRIAHSAPLARSMMGAEAGEAVTFNGRVDAITIERVEPIASA